MNTNTTMHGAPPFLYTSEQPAPVMTPQELAPFCGQHEEYLIAFYLGAKSEDEWNQSTSRFHMNDALLPGVIYLPVQVEKDDKPQLELVYRTARACENVIFINHAAPHKSNEVMKKFANNPVDDGDYFVRNMMSGDFSIEDGNGQACLDMLRGQFHLEDFDAPVYVIVGTGNAGSLFARKIAQHRGAALVLVDCCDKSALASELHAHYCCAAENIPASVLDGRDTVVVVDATTHQNAREKLAPALPFVQKYDAEKHIIFIDYSMHCDAEDYASFGLRAEIGTGKEYVMYTNYLMMKILAEYAQWRGFTSEAPSFATFAEKVRRSEARR